jgi:fructosamine-3-kinase
VSLPRALAEALAVRFGALGACRPVPGGSVSRAYRVETARKGPVFLKYCDTAASGFFRAEAEGLKALAAAAEGALRVPAVLAHAEQTGAAPAWIAMEWLDGGRGNPAADEALGRALAALHRVPQSGWGWHESNFIGPLHQANTPRATWGEFWRDHRLAPQLRMAMDAGHRPGHPTEWETLFLRLPYMLESADEQGSSLLHGDLWHGNVLATDRGPALVDPAVYRGHREVDLAMAELFGGFSDRFMAAYQDSFPVARGYASIRRGAYQLYYLLVHVNLFGSPYIDQTAAVLQRCLAA